MEVVSGVSGKQYPRSPYPGVLASMARELGGAQGGAKFVPAAETLIVLDLRDALMGRPHQYLKHDNDGE